MTIHADPLYLNFLISAVLPALTALITHQFAAAPWKASVLAVLSLAGGVANQMIQNHGMFVLSQAGLWSVLTFMSAAVLHAGLLKPVGLTGSAGLIARKVPSGLGRPSAAAHRGPTSLA